MDDDGLAAFLRARLDEDEGYLKSNQHHLWTQRPFREVEAKRAILAIHHPKVFNRYGRDELCCAACVTDHEVYMDDDSPDPWPCATARDLAAVWSDHPGYRQEWKP